MTGSRIRSEFRAVVRRPLTPVLLAGVFVLCAVDAAQSPGRPPLGLLGSLALNTDGNLTYGLGGAALLAGLAVAGYDELADVWHAYGVGAFERFVRALVYALPLAIVARVTAIAGVLTGGAIDGARRGWRWGSLVPIDFGDFATGELRLLLAYLAIAALGSMVALACRSQVVTAAVILAGTAVYVPFVGALANRAGPVLGVLPWAPFGALRGALTGNGAIFGVDTNQMRIVEPLPAALAFVGWFAVLAAWYLMRPALGSADRTVLMYAVPVPAALAVACVAGLALPAAMEGHVPWRWSPQWREATASGQDSRQVSQRWAKLTAQGSDTAGLFVSAAAAADIPGDVATVLRDADSVTVSSESSMLTPEYTQLEIEFRPVRRSGNLVIDRAQLQLHLKQVGSGWRIIRVEGPFVRVEAAP
jgi:hypothetical protein